MRAGRAAVSISKDGRPDPPPALGCSARVYLSEKRKGDRRRRRRERSPMPSRSAPARRGKARARRAVPRPAWPRMPELEQRQVDVIGLGLIALAVFFGCLVYASSDGGEAGSWTVDSLRWLLGVVHYGVPV